MILLSLIILSAMAESQEITRPNPAYKDSLWFSKWDRIVKLDSDSGAEVLNIRNDYGTRKIAVDNRRSKLWVFGPAGLRAYDIAGNRLTTIALEDPPAWPVHLAVNENTGDVWLGVNKILDLFDTDGNRRISIPVGHPIRALAVETIRDAIWVASAQALVLYDTDGTVMDRIVLGYKQGFIGHLAFDPGTESLWVATSSQLLRFDSFRNPVVERNQLGITAIASDQAGKLWVAQGSKLIKYDRSGLEEFDVKPLDTPLLASPILHLSANRADGSAWVGGLLAYAHVSGTGELLRESVLDPWGGHATRAGSL